mgnify:CR=1 FL=1
MATTANTNLTPPLSPPSYRVDGRAFVITGGTQGLGLGIAKQLQQCGAKGLVIVSRNRDKGAQVCQELTTDKCVCRFVAADLSDASQAQQVIHQAFELLQKGGVGLPISGVINAAAITARGNLMTTTAEDFDLQFAINVRAPFLITQAAAQHMIEHKVSNGSIVNIGSIAAHGGAPFIMAYSASKAALAVLTKNNAAELAPHGIRVNGITLGWCYTDNEDRLQSDQSSDGAQWIKKADEGVPLGRILRPADVASTVGFLLSDSSALLTGTMIDLHPDYAHGMLSLLPEDKRL